MVDRGPCTLRLGESSQVGMKTLLPSHLALSMSRGGPGAEVKAS